MEQIERVMDNLRRQSEEWGALNMSSPVFADPNVREKVTYTRVKDGKIETYEKEEPVFGVGLTKDGDYWLEEAGKTEGVVSQTTRVFNTLSAAATATFEPEKALAFDLKLQKLQGEQNLFEVELAKKKLLESEYLNDHLAQREATSAADELAIRHARQDLASATSEREAIEAAVKSRRAVKSQAETKVRRRQLEEDEAQNALDAANDKVADSTAYRRAAETKEASAKADSDAKPTDAALKKAYEDAKAARIRAESEEKTAIDEKTDAERELRNAKTARTQAETAEERATEDLTEAETVFTTAKTAETSARNTLTTALKNQTSSAEKFATTVTSPSSAPLLADSDVTSAAGVGTALAGMKSAIDSIPIVKQTDIDKLGDNAFGRTLRPNTDTGIFSTKSSLIEATGNKTMQEIFNFLGDPGAALVFKDKPILFGVATVAANPGWRTRTDYDGQLDVEAKYQWTVARLETLERVAEAGKPFTPALKKSARHYLDTGRWLTASEAGWSGVVPTASDLNGNGSTPLVAGVSPLMERQALDLNSSNARQMETALFLSAAMGKAGMKGQAEVFNKFVKLQRQDASTRTAMPVLNAYNFGGGIFGFQFGPRLDALDNPGSRKAKPAKQLGKQSFPVLLMCGFAQEDIRPRFAWVQGQSGRMEMAICEPMVELVQTTRWSRQRKRGAFHAALRSVVFPGFPGRPMQEPSEIYRDLEEITRAFVTAGSMIKAYNAKYPDLQLDSWITKVRADLNTLKAAYFGYDTTLNLPVTTMVGAEKAAEKPAKVPGMPVVRAVFPQRMEGIPVGPAAPDMVEGTIAIGGENFDRLDSAAAAVLLPEGAGEVTVEPNDLGFSGKQMRAFRVRLRHGITRFQLKLTALSPEDEKIRLPVHTPMIQVFVPATVEPRIVETQLKVDGPGQIVRVVQAPAKPGQEQVAPPRHWEWLARVRVTTQNMTPQMLAELVPRVVAYTPGKPKEPVPADWKAPEVVLQRVIPDSEIPNQTILELRVTAVPQLEVLTVTFEGNVRFFPPEPNHPRTVAIQSDPVVLVLKSEL